MTDKHRTRTMPEDQHLSEKAKRVYSTEVSFRGTISASTDYTRLRASTDDHDNLVGNAQIDDISGGEVALVTALTEPRGEYMENPRFSSYTALDAEAAHDLADALKRAAEIAEEQEKR